MEITHLVVNGCSWTYCQGLDDPKTQGWPALVAKDLGVPVVNIALPGSGNDAIHRRTYEYVYQNLPTGSKPLFLIFWSQYWRREAWYEFKDLEKIQDYRGIHPGLRKPFEEKDELEAALLSHKSDEDSLRKTLLYKLSIINLFKSCNIPFLMTDFVNDEPNLSEVGICMKKALEKEMCHVHKDEATFRLINSFPKLPCQHDGVEAQIETSKWWMTNIYKMFPNLSVVTEVPFLTLEHYHLQKVNPFLAWV